MDVINVLQVFAPLALAVFAIGVAPKFIRWGRGVLAGGTFSGRSKNEIDSPERESPLRALVRVLYKPMTFSSGANASWTAGYALYHVGIITIFAGYSLAAALLGVNILLGNPVPNMTTGEFTQQLSLVNLLAIVFGNAESPAREFLFGPAAPVFLGVTWVAVISAFLGNVALFGNAFRNKGAIVGDIHEAARGFRTSGRFSLEHVLITGLVFGIVITELLARLASSVPAIPHNMLYYHLLLAMAIVVLTPFTFLKHIVFFPITLYYATRRRVTRTIA